jgi:hypothetical protein
VRACVRHHHGSLVPVVILARAGRDAGEICRRWRTLRGLQPAMATEGDVESDHASAPGTWSGGTSDEETPQPGEEGFGMSNFPWRQAGDRDFGRAGNVHQPPGGPQTDDEETLKPAEFEEGQQAGNEQAGNVQAGNVQQPPGGQQTDDRLPQPYGYGRWSRDFWSSDYTPAGTTTPLFQPAGAERQNPAAPVLDDDETLKADEEEAEEDEWDEWDERMIAKQNQEQAEKIAKQNVGVRRPREEEGPEPGGPPQKKPPCIIVLKGKADFAQDDRGLWVRPGTNWAWQGPERPGTTNLLELLGGSHFPEDGGKLLGGSHFPEDRRGDGPPAIFLPPDSLVGQVARSRAII